MLQELADRVRQQNPRVLVISEMETGNLRPTLIRRRRGLPREVETQVGRTRLRVRRGHDELELAL